MNTRKIIYAIALSVGVVLCLETCSATQAIDWPEGDVVFVAHRGGRVPGYPENTLAAFRQAIKYGVDAIEIDLRGTKDGKIVIIHDPTVDRTTDGHGRVSNHSLAELKELDAGNGERIPTYEEVLELVNGTGVRLLLDIKLSPTVDKREVVEVVRLTEEFAATSNVIVGVYSPDDLRAFRTLNPNLLTLGRVTYLPRIEQFAQEGVDIIDLPVRDIYANPDLVRDIHQLGKQVWVKAVLGSREELEELVELGVDGIVLGLSKIID
jgi:glycerophosphoryl diester phosphodiesterase